MNELETRVARALDEVVPRSDESGDWSRVVHDARADRRRRWLPRVGLAAAALAGAAAFALAAPFGSDSSPFLDKALAAFGTGPIVHAVLEGQSPGAAVVDLESGRARRQSLLTEYWWDDERRSLRTRITIDGVFLTELIESPKGSWSDLGNWGGNPQAGLDPALAGFANRYRTALRAGTAREVGRETVDGRELVILRISHGSDYQEVAVYADDYQPRRLRWRQADGTVGDWTTVRSIETLPRNPKLFAPPERSKARPTSQAVKRERELTRAEAAAMLDGRALWPGPSIGGATLGEIHLTEIELEWMDGRETRGEGLELVYGDPSAGRRDRSKPWLVLTEAGSAADAGFAGAMGGPPIPPEGSVHLQRRGPFWTGEVQKHGVFVVLHAGSRELVIAAAKALGPID